MLNARPEYPRDQLHSQHHILPQVTYPCSNQHKVVTALCAALDQTPGPDPSHPLTQPTLSIACAPPCDTGAAGEYLPGQVTRYPRQPVHRQQYSLPALHPAQGSSGTVCSRAYLPGPVHSPRLILPALQPAQGSSGTVCSRGLTDATPSNISASSCSSCSVTPVRKLWEVCGVRHGHTQGTDSMSQRERQQGSFSLAR